MVVVRHDEIDPQIACEERLVDRGHPAVDRDDHLRAIGRIGGLRGHDPKPLRCEGHVKLKYLARLFTFALILWSCAPSAVANAPTGSSLPAAPSITPAGPSGLATAPHAIFGPIRQWYLLPDPLFHEDVHVAVTFPDIDPS